MPANQDGELFSILFTYLTIWVLLQLFNTLCFQTFIKNLIYLGLPVKCWFSIKKYIEKTKQMSYLKGQLKEIFTDPISVI